MNSTRLWHLLGRKLAGEATLEEIRELEKLLTESPEIAAQVEIHSQYFGMKDKDTEPSAEELLAWGKQLKRINDDLREGSSHNPVPILKDGSRSGGRWRRLGLLPAAAVIITLIGIMVWQLESGKTFSIRPVAEDPLVTVLQTSLEKIKDTLPDGSIVWLNSGTRIAYDRDFGRNNRNLTLTGEAFFDVVHKAELPMVVHAGLVDIRVKGTAFNVRSYRGDEEVEASLIRGSIELTFTADRQRKILLRPNEKIVVRTGDKGSREHLVTPMDHKDQNKILHYTLDTLAVESRSGLIPEISWLENKLVFNSEPLSELTEKMERWYNVSIRIKDTLLLKERFTGVLEKETLAEAFSALQLTYPFHYRIDKNLVIITRK